MENKKVKILAIDDIADNLISLKALFYEVFSGCELITALDGITGIALAETHDPDVILLDIVMPGMDGFEVCKRLKANPELVDIPVVFLTALKADKESRVRALDVGAEAFLSKPIDVMELTAQIRAMVKIREANLAKRDEASRLKKMVAEKTRELEAANQKTRQLLDDLIKENEARRNSEELLRVSETRFKTISELTSDIAYSCLDSNNGTYSIDWMTGAVESITGYSVEEVMNHKCWRFLVEKEDHPIFNKSVVGIEPNNQEICELKIKHKNGSTRYLRSYAKVVFDHEKNNTKRLYGGLVDITHSKEIYDKIRESEEKFKQSFEASNVGKSITSIDGRINVNDAFCQMLGYSKEELSNKSWRDLTPSEEIPLIDEYLQPLIFGEKKSTRFNKRYICKDGSEIWCDVSVAIQRDRDDKPMNFMTTVVNINETKIAQEQLQLSEKKFRLAFMTSPDSINLNKLSDGVFIDVNEGFTSMMGYSREDVIGKSSLDLNIWNNINDRHLLVEELASKGFIVNLEVEFRTKSGQIITGLMSARLVEINNEKIILNITRDITDRKETDKKLELAGKKWNETFESIQDAIAILDNNHKIIQCNKAFLKVINKTEPEIINSQCFFHVHGTSCPVNGCPYTAVRGSKQRESTEMEINGLHYNVLVDPIVDENNDVIGAVHIMTDITKNKIIEQELSRSEQRFKFMIEKSPEAIALIDSSGQFKYVSPTSFTIFGYDTEEFGSLIPNDLTHPDDLPGLYPLLTDLMQKPGGSFKHIYRFKHKENSWKWIESTFTNLLHEPAIEAIVINFADIHQRYEAEQALRENEEKYKKLIEISKDAVFIIDDLKITYINSAGIELFGAESPSQILDRSPEDFFHFDYQKSVMEHIDSMINNENQARTIEEKIIRLDGQIVDVDVSATVFYLKGKRSIQVVLRNITDRKKNDLMREIQFDIAEAVVTTRSLDELFHIVREKIGKLVDTTNFTLALYDPQSEVISLPFSIDHATNNPKTVPISRSLTGKIITQRKPLILTDENIRQMAENGEIDLFGARAKIWLGIPLMHNERIIGALILQSYTNANAYDQQSIDLLKIIANQLAIYVEKKKNEADLFIAKEKAEESDRLKTAFLNNMSHEIRTPLNGITGFTNILSYPDTTHEDIESYAPLINNASEQLCTIIDDIICIATIEAGQEVLRNAPVDLNLIMRELYTEFKDKPDTTKIIVNYRTQLSDEQSKLITDETKLTKVLRNLLSNAVKFTSQGVIEFGCVLEGEAIHFKVRDSGIGIPLEHQNLIFERFRQIKSERDREFGGNGLGLAISKAYVEMMGGKIWFDSEPGKGSVFHFTIAYNPSETQNLKGSDHEIPAQDYLSKESKTILVAEDEWSNFMLIEKLLEPYNFGIIHVLNGIEAVEAADKYPDIDLILMDLKMPEMDGFDATRIIKNDHKNIPIIAVTAYALSGDRENALEAGCDDYIAKPIKINILLEKINNLKRAQQA